MINKEYLFKDITIIDENFDVAEHMDVLLSDDRIAKITSASGETSDQVSEDVEIFDGKNYILMPGFFDAHGHTPMSLMRGYGENLTLEDWLFTRIFPFEDKLTGEAVYYGTLLSMAESFKYGIISTNDMYYFVDDIAAAVRDSGAKINVSRAIANPEGIPFDTIPSINEFKESIDKHHNSENGRILIDAALHAEYTSNEDTAKSLAELTKSLGLRMHVHVSETQSEHLGCKERHQGRTPTKYLADAGIFDVPATAAHCVWIEDEDVEILRDKKVTVATNPVSNLKLASGICDVKKLLDNGVTVALGTDSVASNNNLSMFEEMKTMCLLAKVKNMDPTVLTPKEALRIATLNGALSQGRTDTGCIKEGNKADLVLLKKNSPNLYPAHYILNNIVYSATDSDIYMTMVDGKIVYRDGELLTIDIEDTIKGVNKSVKDILSRL